MLVNGKPCRTVWIEGTVVRMINQPLLPHRFEIYDSHDHRQTARAIREMIVRGAPAIGATAAYGLAQAVMEAPTGSRRAEFIEAGHQLLRATRPTAQNLFYALDRIMAAIGGVPEELQVETAIAEAEALADEDAASNHRIGQHGADLIKDGMTVLTHCNAGWLACVDWGTALSPMYVAHREGRRVSVFADETRPRLQGANLTAWELQHEGIDCRIIADNAAGLLMRRGEVQLVITGADRVAANGDVANKIGTYGKALLAHANGIPFYVAVPMTTFDPDCSGGDAIPIEERDEGEVLYITGLTDSGEIGRVRIAPEGVGARNPAFDVTPAELITGLITPEGIIPATPGAIAKLLGR